MGTSGIKLAIIALIGCVFLSISGLMLWYRGNAIKAEGERDTAKANLATALAVNTANDAALKALTAGRAIDDKLLVELQGRLQSLAATTDSAFTAVRQLEKTNATVADYMRTVLPDDLKRLLATGRTDHKTGGDSRVAP